MLQNFWRDFSLWIKVFYLQIHWIRSQFRYEENEENVKLCLMLLGAVGWQAHNIAQLIRVWIPNRFQRLYKCTPHIRQPQTMSSNANTCDLCKRQCSTNKELLAHLRDHARSNVLQGAIDDSVLLSTDAGFKVPHLFPLLPNVTREPYDNNKKTYNNENKPSGVNNSAFRC